MIIRRRRCNSRAVLYADLILAKQITRFLAILMAFVKRETVYRSYIGDLKSLIERLVYFKGSGPLKWTKILHRNFEVPHIPISLVAASIRGARTSYRMKELSVVAFRKNGLHFM